MSSPHARRTYLLTYLCLLVLLGAAVGFAQIDLGPFDPVVALTIASTKALLVAWFFMHLRNEQGLVRASSVIGLVWLSLLFVFLLSDYLGRQPATEHGSLVEQQAPDASSPQ